MGVPISQMFKVASYVIGKKLQGQQRYPLVLMLEPLFRCNLTCEGCGKIQYPDHILKKRITPAQALAAAEECGAPMVSIAGGEPLLHPEITEIVDGLIKQGRYIYLCTNALLLARKIDSFKPHKQLTLSVHMDGLEQEHDHAVARNGTFKIAREAIAKAVNLGFRVATNTTLFNSADPRRVRLFFDEMMALGVDDLMLSPGYAYPKAPSQEIFLSRERTILLFKKIFSRGKKSWKLNLSPNFVAFLQGKRDYDCTPWGTPTYNVFGWQKPCYLLSDGYVRTFKELLEATEWEKYGRQSGEPRCRNCMVHCGFEPSSVRDTFTVGGVFRHFSAERHNYDFNGEDPDSPMPTLPAQEHAHQESEKACACAGSDAR
ncbi:MAG: adenosyl-hopene transferase HpnH [Puniceicoccales bacterium]|nr:adenosyl-hopene transferase HpnH [Puniceicoccales bacterium]